MSHYKDTITNSKRELKAVIFGPYAEGGHERLELLRDKSAKGERLAEITIRNRKIWCSLDNSEDCDHIHFALAIPEFGRLVKS